MQPSSFDTNFAALTDAGRPFPWLGELFKRFISDKPNHIPASCNIPTGLGKTSVVAVWLIALATRPERMPRRLVYVVNRRTVVDQTTEEVVNYRRRLAELDELEPLRKKLGPLAISTLRGQFADNREWSADPARPAVIVGTVDMIGSRLLFSGYGVGFKGKPLHAGFLGQDVLLVHDEAHLEPAFQKLIETIEREQHVGERTEKLPWPRIHVMALSATSRNGNHDTDNTDRSVELSDEDYVHPKVKQRIEATKVLTPVLVNDEEQLADKIAEFALARRKDANGNDTNAAVLVFVRRLKDVAKVCARLTDKKTGVGEDHVQQLTGTMRGFERDRMADPRRIDASRVFARFLKPSKPDAEARDQWKINPTSGTVYLVCTSAGEVGIDISADHMVCDLSTFDSMVQRFGRVNRYGNRIDTRIDVVHPKEFGKKDKKTGELKADDIDVRRQKTIELLRTLPSLGENLYDASPLALSNLNADDRDAAFAPKPAILTSTDILFDAWAMTSIREKMPGQPEVGPYLHGIADELPQTTIAWRAELDLFATDPDPRKKLQAIFTKHRIRPHETVTTNSNRFIEFLKTITKKRDTLLHTRVAILFSRHLMLPTIGDLIEKPGPLYADPTLVLPATFGYLDKSGMLSVDAIPDEPNDDKPQQSFDIADFDGYESALDIGTRLRVLIEQSGEQWEYSPLPRGKPLPDSLSREPATSTKLINKLRVIDGKNYRVRLVQPIEFNEEGDPLKSLVALTPMRVQPPAEEQTLVKHVEAVENAARTLADKLKLPEPFRAALLFAAKWHDEGKKAEIWQRYIGGKDGLPPLGKSAKWCDPRKLRGYRHEFGSLLRIRDDEALRFFSDPQLNLTAEQQEHAYDLALHLIAAHHGNARPHFSNSFDREFTTQQSDEVHTDAIRRFARLQRKYGRWGLAYLESLLRAADGAASAGLETDDEIEAFNGGDE